MNPESKEQIRRRIRELLESPSPYSSVLAGVLDSKLRAAVSKLEALPLFLDMGGCYALTVDGEIISFAWDNEMDIQIERDERIRNIALFQGSKKYPELAALVPTKPMDAPDCPSCKSTGKLIFAEEWKTSEELRNSIVCYCGGLGWLPHNDPGATAGSQEASRMPGAELE